MNIIEGDVASDKGSIATRGDGLAARFYRTVDVSQTPDGQGWHVLLDNRILTTPAKKRLVLPSQMIAMAVAAEWEWQDARNIRTFTMPFMSLAATAVDRIPQTRELVVDQLLEFFETDTLCCRTDGEALYRKEAEQSLTQKEAEKWDPLVDWVAGEIGARPVVSTSIFGPTQPEAVVEGMRRKLEAADDWELAGIMMLSQAAKSLVAALALAKGRLKGSDALAIIRLEENHQAEEWGYVQGGHDIDDADFRVRLAAPALFLQLLRVAREEAAARKKDAS